MWAAFLTKATRARWRASAAAGKWSPGVNGGKPEEQAKKEQQYEEEQQAEDGQQAIAGYGLLGFDKDERQRNLEGKHDKQQAEKAAQDEK